MRVGEHWQERQDDFLIVAVERSDGLQGSFRLPIEVGRRAARSGGSTSDERMLASGETPGSAENG